jgi:hypothetical protein
MKQILSAEEPMSNQKQPEPAAVAGPVCPKCKGSRVDISYNVTDGKTNRRHYVTCRTGEKCGYEAWIDDLTPFFPAPSTQPRPDFKFLLSDLLNNRACGCGGWNCPRCIISVNESAEALEREVPEFAAPSTTEDVRPTAGPDLIYGDRPSSSGWGTYTRNGEANSGGNIVHWYESAIFWRNRAEGVKMEFDEVGAAPSKDVETPKSSKEKTMTTVVDATYRVLSNNADEWVITKADDPYSLWNGEGWKRVDDGEHILNFPTEQEAQVYAQQQPALHGVSGNKPWCDWPTEHLLRKIAMPEGFVNELRERFELESVRAENAEAEIRRLGTPDVDTLAREICAELYLQFGKRHLVVSPLLEKSSRELVAAILSRRSAEPPLETMEDDELRRLWQLHKSEADRYQREMCKAGRWIARADKRAEASAEPNQGEKK